MNKVKLISVIALGLLISNLILVCFIFFNKPEPPMHHGPRDIIIERLNLDDRQVREYDRLIRWHRAQVHEKEREMIQLKNKLYSNLTQADKQLNNDSLANEIGKVQARLEHIHYRHFQDIKKLCTPSQRPLFDDLVKDIAHLFARRPGGPRPDH